MQDIVSIWCMAAWKLCLVVDSQVKIWACTLSYKNCHLTLVCLQHHFGTILTIFAKLKYCCDFYKLAITLQPSKWRIMSLSYPHLKYCVLQVLWCERSHSSWMSCHVFPYQYLICYYSIWFKEEHQQRTRGIQKPMQLWDFLRIS